MMVLDIAYAENKSFWLDLQIMMKTFPVMVSQLQEARVRRQQAPGCVSEAAFNAGEDVAGAVFPHDQERSRVNAASDDLLLRSKRIAKLLNPFRAL
jgi:hypothetical protein